MSTCFHAFYHPGSLLCSLSLSLAQQSCNSAYNQHATPRIRRIIDGNIPWFQTSVALRCLPLISVRLANSVRFENNWLWISHLKSFGDVLCYWDNRGKFSYFSVTWPNHKDRVVEGLTHSLEKRQQKVTSQLPVLHWGSLNQLHPLRENYPFGTGITIRHEKTAS